MEPITFQENLDTSEIERSKPGDYLAKLEVSMDEEGGLEVTRVVSFEPSEKGEEEKPKKASKPKEVPKGLMKAASNINI